MSNDPIEREREFRKRIEEAVLSRRAARPSRRVFGWLGSILGFAAGWIRLVLVLAVVASFAGLFLFIFGLSIKWTDAYACSIAQARRSAVIIAEVGESAEPGFFAWSFAYVREASTTDASFSTDLSGPKGAGTLKVRFYRSPLGSSLSMDLEKDGRLHVVHRGPAVCE